MAEDGGGGNGRDAPIVLEYTPTWIVAIVCSIIVSVSVLIERLLHLLGKYLKKKNQKTLYEAVLKVKEELMLLGFISLLLTVCQGVIQQICIPHSWTKHMLPCRPHHPHNHNHEHRGPVRVDAAAVEENLFAGAGRRLLAEDLRPGAGCPKGKVPLLSLEAIDALHIFIFILAVTHVVFSVLTLLLGGAKIRQWKQWEDLIQKDVAGNVSNKITHVHESEFIKDRFKGMGTHSPIIGWLHSFLKQFYGSVTKSDYTTMRLGFIMTHCKTNQKFDFHKYMVRALEADFKKVIGIRWYLWIFLVIFLLLNVNGWHAYFWISFIPLISDLVSHYYGLVTDYIPTFTSRRNPILHITDGLLLSLGTKLEHVITQLAHEVAEKHYAIEGDLVVKPSDDHFWFHRPRLVIYLIHFILFENAFEIAYFFWIWTTYGFHSCIMGRALFLIPRLVIGMIIQLLCSYSTLPLYAIVTQMGSSFKIAIFDENVQEGLMEWAQKVKRRMAPSPPSGSRSILRRVASRSRSLTGIQLNKMSGRKDVQMEESEAGIVADGTDSDILLQIPPRNSH